MGLILVEDGKEAAALCVIEQEVDPTARRVTIDAIPRSDAKLYVLRTEIRPRDLGNTNVLNGALTVANHIREVETAEGLPEIPRPLVLIMAHADTLESIPGADLEKLGWKRA